MDTQMNLFAIPLKPIPSLKVVGGNIVVELDDEDYKRGIDHLRFSVLGRLSLHRGDSIATIIEVRSKLMESLGRGFASDNNGQGSFSSPSKQSQ